MESTRREFLTAGLAGWACALTAPAQPLPPSLEQIRFRRTWEKDITVTLDSSDPRFDYLSALYVAHGCRLAGGLPEKLRPLEPWTTNVRAVSDLAVLVRDPACYAELDRRHYLYDLADPAGDLAAYKVVVAAPEQAVRMNAFRARGGTVVQFPSSRFPAAIETEFSRPSILAPGLPADAVVTVLEQRIPGGLRRVVHVLNYPAAQEKPGFLKDVRLSVLLPQHPMQVMTVPNQKAVEFKHNEFYTTFTLARVQGHQAVVLE